MAERKRDTQERSGESAESRRRSRSLGRRLATGLVVCGLLYLIGVGLLSVIPQVFWPEAAEVDPSISCADGLRDLRAELLAWSGERVASGGQASTSGLDRYFERWDLRHRGLEARCDASGESDAWVRLGRMRERLQGTLERFDDEEGALARSLDDLLASPSSPRRVALGSAPATSRSHTP